MPPRSKGRTGRPWLRIRATVIANSDVCCICGQPVDKTLKKPDPMSPSVDHIDPLSRGGAEHDPANLRLAHYGCNSRKGNRENPLTGLGRQSRRW